MRNALQGFGLFFVLTGVSGVVDHLWTQPFLGLFLNWFERFVVPRVEVLADHAIEANLGLAVVGLVLFTVGTAGFRR